MDAVVKEAKTYVEEKLIKIKFKNYSKLLRRFN